MTVRVVAFRDLTASPWRNGGGVTYEVTSIRDGAGEGAREFDWRLSIARIDGDGCFSVFDGVDRHLVLLTDDLALDISDPDDPSDVESRRSRLRRLHRGDIAAFPGECRVEAQVGPQGATVVNVMSRRAACRSQLEVVACAASARWSTPGLVAVVDLATGDTLLVDGLDDGDRGCEGLHQAPLHGAQLIITRHVGAADRRLA